MPRDFGAVIQRFSDDRSHRFTAWNQPENLIFDTPEAIEGAYETGMAGAVDDPEADEELMDVSRFKTGDRVCSTFGWYDDESPIGKLIYPLQHVQKLMPGCIPGPGQVVGDCVSQNGRGSMRTTYCCSVAMGLKNPVTNELMGIPSFTPVQLKQGGFATEPPYWFRGHGGHGWNCGVMVRILITKAGLVIREPLAGTNIDLSTYGKRNTEIYGRRKPPVEVADAIDNNLYVDGVKVENDPEVYARFLMRGISLITCGGESFSSKRPTIKDDQGRDCAGPNPRTRKGWAHAMEIAAVDWRDWTVRQFGEPLALLVQTWGRWGSGPRNIANSPYTMPHGCFWVRVRDITRRSLYAVSGANGWTRPLLPDMGIKLA